MREKSRSQIWNEVAGQMMRGGIIGLVAFSIALAYMAVPSLIGRIWPTESQQIGPRGTGLFLPRKSSDLATLRDANALPASVPHPEDEGYRAGDVYENLKVLGDLNTGQFTRLMVNITEWVAPEEGCAACHSVENFAEDSLYTKVVARRMLEMVRHINGAWTEHVGETGVTCYTCHRGELVPPNIWYNDPGPEVASGFSPTVAMQNHPASAVGYTSLPRDPMSSFLEASGDIRVQADTTRPVEGRPSIKQAEHTHALMMHMSNALGVNCDFCHNTRAFSEWPQSPPQRKTAWYGIRMARDLNANYVNPLSAVLPEHRLGAAGDAPKISCATCHNGVFKPLFGERMVAEFPELQPIAPEAEQALYEEPPW
jgi:photosynthetic reaction center cytochrome c subunit